MAVGIEGGYKLPQQGGIKSVYDSAASQQAEDYDSIMGGYDSILNNARTNPSAKLNYTPINPVFNRNIQGYNYQRTPELNTALTGLQDYSRTGGYSDADIGNIRERAISPIRSIYDSASRNINRQKVLSGGYSPNAGALQAKLARESSSRIGDVTTNANAAIAEMVAQGKLSGLNSLGSVAGRENEVSNQYNAKNIEGQNEVERMNADEQRRVDTQNQQMQQWIEEFNNRTGQQGEATQLNALGGKTNLYGTTPALTRTFGDQVLQNNQQNMNAVTTANQIKNQRANVGLNLVNSQLTGGRMG